METKLTLINTNLRRYTFESPKIKTWVESRSIGRVLNLFAGKTRLNINETRVDISNEFIPDHVFDALDFVIQANEHDIKFDTVICDPPYSMRKAMEMYHGNYTSRFKLLANELTKITSRVISFGYHSTFLGKVRGYKLEEMCIFAHGGAQHCTIAIVEVRNG